MTITKPLSDADKARDLMRLLFDGKSLLNPPPNLGKPGTFAAAAGRARHGRSGSTAIAETMDAHGRADPAETAAQ